MREVRDLLLAGTQRVIHSDAAVVLLGNAPPDHGWASSATLIESVRQNGLAEHTATSLCVPIGDPQKSKSVVVLWREVGRPSFTSTDETLLGVLTNQADVAFERARLHRQETHRLAMEQELTVARQIQRTMVPSAPPRVAGWDFAAAYHPAHEVGGDFYDFMHHGMDDDHLGVAIADVTGKGVPAGLMMGYSRAALRAGAFFAEDPAQVMDRSNRLIIQEHHAGLFVSAFYADIDLRSGQVNFASAGHDPPLWVKRGGTPIVDLQTPGVWLGGYHDTGIETRSIDLEPGDTLILYTDGVTEARDEDRQLFGEQRLRSVASAAGAGDRNAKSVLESVLLAVAEFCGDAEQADDLTIVVVQREPRERGSRP